MPFFAGDLYQLKVMPFFAGDLYQLKVMPFFAGDLYQLKAMPGMIFHSFPMLLLLMTFTNYNRAVYQ